MHELIKFFEEKYSIGGRVVCINDFYVNIRNDGDKVEKYLIHKGEKGKIIHVNNIGLVIMWRIGKSTYHRFSDLENLTFFY